MLRSAEAIAALLNSSRELYADAFRTGRLQAQWQERGMLFVFRTPAQMEHYAEVDHLLRTRFDMPATPYSAAQLCELEPALKPDLAGAWHYPRDAHVRPDQLMHSWDARVRQLGVEVRENCDLQGFVTTGRDVVRVQTSQGEIDCEQVILATGAWTAQLQSLLRCSLPIQPGKGYSITMARPRLCPSYPLIFEEDHVAITPFVDGYRIGSTMEFAGFDTRLNPARIQILTNAAKRYLHEPEADPVEERWWGWRPMVFDGKPIIGPAPKLPNVMLATGHGMLGLSMATATARLVRELIMQTTPHIDPKPYSPGRF
jgi:D-amino-acid dehydrogenase